jgi:hypothetical protein
VAESPSGRARNGRCFAVRAWVTGLLILLSTYVLVPAHRIQPQDWAVAVSFIMAHILAHEVIRAGHHQRE